MKLKRKALKLLHLQGLRAFAIIFVVLFHFFPQYFPNGYLGVDQFFLFSGYLMTMMLERNPELTVSAVLDFFYRRVKRIVPLYYLATLVIILAINLTPTNTVLVNLESANKALPFLTNLIRPDALEDYNARLGLGVDMFTHTWSLSLEMQFYFLFPFIFYLYLKTSSQNIYVTTLVLLSFLYHAYSDSFISFYSVFARIWQFLAGLAIFYESNKMKGEYETLVEEGCSIEENRSLHNLVASSSIVVLLAMMTSRVPIDPLIGRIVTILMTTLIVHVGGNNAVMENRILVFVGEISYSWYLVHWPIVALFKMNEFTSDSDMLMGMLGSILISVAIYFTYEKWYLSWDKTTTGLAVAFLLVLNGAALLQVAELAPKSELDESAALNETIAQIDLTQYNGYIYESDLINEIPYGYETMNSQERANLNNYWSATDAKRLRNYPCRRLKDLDIPLPREWKCENQKGANTSTKMSLLVMGNSYVGNNMKAIFEQCKDVFTDIYSTWTGSCEPLLFTRTVKGLDCSYDNFYLETVKEFKPDVLFIFTRFFDSLAIRNGTSPFNDANFKMMVERLTEIQKHVKYRIYMAQSFAWPKHSMGAIVNDHLLKRAKITHDDVVEKGLENAFQIGKMRMDRLVQHCEKCRLFDYTAQFYIDGKLQYYDPKYHIVYFTRSLHLTPPGLLRLAPMYRHMCHNL